MKLNANYSKWTSCFAVAMTGWLLTTSASAEETVWLDSLDLSTMHQGWGGAQANHSVTGKPLTIAGKQFDHGVGTHAISTYVVELAGGSKSFKASVGLDDDITGPGSVVFELEADGKNIFRSGVMKPKTPAKEVEVELTGVKRLTLRVTDAGDGGQYDHADWVDARFVFTGVKPVAFIPEVEKPYILTPKPGPAPEINGPVIFGARPGNPFLYRIPAQGDRPMTFVVKDLPAGLLLDSELGIISGTTPARGEYKMTFQATNKRGTQSRGFKLVSGDTLALTPTMGWNDWYAHYDRITDTMMREGADAMLANGMADVGYQYVNIDDCWMNAQRNRDSLRNAPFRDAAGNLLPNRHFPDMKALAGYIHSLGLKAGLYTSPGKLTCGGFAGAFQHEAQDAKLFADWGFDFLKYDWCSYNVEVSKNPSLEEMKRPYILMGNLLKEQKRDMVLNLCQYGMGEVYKWGQEVGGHSWRTAGDLGYELDRIFPVALKNAEFGKWQKPGGWNDPDYIQIGYIGAARKGGLPTPCAMPPTEQYAYMSLWCLMASPLFYGGDITKLDEFTLNILCNTEVIEVDQDPLGLCATATKLDRDTFLMVKAMEDGSKAVGLGNQGESEAVITATWEQLGVTGTQRVRDLWRQQDLGNVDGNYTVKVPGHGVVLVRLWSVK